MTYYDTKDAFAAIENGSKLRKPDELPFDLCFGGRRQFCQTSYADLGMLIRHSVGSNSSQPRVLLLVQIVSTWLTDNWRYCALTRS